MRGAWWVPGPRSPRLSACPADPKCWLTGFGWHVEPNPGPRQRRAIFAGSGGRRCHASDGHALRNRAPFFRGLLRSPRAPVGKSVTGGWHRRGGHAGGQLPARVSRHGRALRILLEHLCRRPEAATVPLPAHWRACDRCAFHTGTLMEIDEGLPSGGAARVPCASARHCGSGCGNVGLSPAGD